MIAIDTNIFIYTLEMHPRFGPAAVRLLEGVERGEFEAIISVITLAEILTLPARKNDRSRMDKYRSLLLHFPHLRCLPVSAEIAEKAATFRGKDPGLKLMDAFILATAAIGEAKVLVTEDSFLRKRKNPFVPVKTLEEYFRSR